MTKDQAEKLADVLADYQDEGPVGEGWASPKLEELREIVDAATMQMSEPFVTLGSRRVAAIYRGNTLIWP